MRGLSLSGSEPDRDFVAYMERLVGQDIPGKVSKILCSGVPYFYPRVGDTSVISLVPIYLPRNHPIVIEFIKQAIRIISEIPSMDRGDSRLHYGTEDNPIENALDFIGYGHPNGAFDPLRQAADFLLQDPNREVRVMRDVIAAIGSYSDLYPDEVRDYTDRVRKAEPSIDFSILSA